jgi:hypothetical protein
MATAAAVITPPYADPDPTPPAKPVRTILGVDLRRLIVGTINGLAMGRPIRVIFRGTRAYTDGNTVVLPKIRDLAEIPYDKARALIGYAIHELGHILFTDWKQVERAFNEGKLVKKFENCIEDYRIERELVREFPGAKDDLTALRIRIHPRLSDLTTGWLRDPRACGPLALTWTGSRLNGFPNPHIQETMDAIAQPVQVLIERWTQIMDGVPDTATAVDLAIRFKAEADEYAARTRLPDMAKPKPPEPANDVDPTEPQDPTADGSSQDEPEKGDDPGTPENGADDDQRGDDPGTPDDGASKDGEPGAGQGDDAAQPGESQTPPDGVDDLDFGAKSPSGEGKPSKGGSAPEKASLGVDGELLGEEHDPDGELGESESPEGEPASASDEDADGDAGSAGDDATDGTSGQGGQKPSAEEIDPAQAERGEDDGSGPREGEAVDDSDDDGHGFGDSLDGSASFDDMIDDIAEAIADDVRNGGALPEEEPDATDGEVDPSSLQDDVGDANAAAPDYTSKAGDQQKGKPGGNGSSKNHWDDKRFTPVSTEVQECAYEQMRSAAAGTISTTARTIRRLLMAEAQSGSISNRRSGQFDIRNMSAIVRGTGTCYKKEWSKPAPSTLLTVLTDFSGSMNSSMAQMIAIMNGGRVQEDDDGPVHAPVTLAMMGALAIDQATRGTQVTTAIYAYTGTSPNVEVSIFKEGVQSPLETRRRIGAYRNVSMDMTPTAEAMAAVASRIENSPEDRKILLVLTDGRADNMKLAAEVAALLVRRGIEVVVIGIGNDSVREWAPVSHVINDIRELPQALLSTIDPRAAKKRRMAA